MATARTEIWKQREDIILRHALPADGSWKPEILGNCQTREDRPLFGAITNAETHAVIGRHSRGVAPFEQNRSALPRQRAHDCTENRRLAGTIAADETHNLP